MALDDFGDFFLNVHQPSVSHGWILLKLLPENRHPVQPCSAKVLETNKNEPKS